MQHVGKQAGIISTYVGMYIPFKMQMKRITPSPPPLIYTFFKLCANKLGFYTDEFFCAKNFLQTS